MSNFDHAKHHAWKDTTSYSRGERGIVEPRAWTLDLDALRVVVHRLHGCDGWFFSCVEMYVDRRMLVATAPAEARMEALQQLRSRWRAIGIALDEARDVQHVEVGDLIASSSIGAGLANIHENGIDAELADLERETKPRRRKR